MVDFPRWIESVSIFRLLLLQNPIYHIPDWF